MKIFIFIVLLPLTIQTQNWNWDSSFGVNGVLKLVLENRDTRLVDFETVNQNSIIVGVNSYYTSPYGGISDRDFYIYKIDQNGNINTDFGTNGYYHQPSGGGSIMTRVIDIKFHPIENSIYITATILGNLKMLKLNLAGEIDTEFGENGYLDINISRTVMMDFLDDGRIILLGYNSNTYEGHYKLIRVFSNGSIDTSFGSNGEVIINPTLYDEDVVGNFRILSNNMIIIVGYSFSGNDATSKAVIVKLNENGELVEDFANNGVLIENIGIEETAKYYDLVISENEEIIVTGAVFYQGGTGGWYGSKALISKYDITGNLISAFGNNGIRIFEPVNSANESFKSVDILDDEIIAVGTSGMPFPNSQSFFYMTLIDEIGNYNTNFFNNGYLTTHFEDSPTNVAQKVIYLDNNIFSGGISKNPLNSSFEAVICKVTQNTMSIDDIDENCDIKIYPNPFLNQINISHTEKIKQISIYSPDGKLIFKESFINPLSKISIDINLNNSIYFLKIVDVNGYRLTKKIINK